ncbi:MAG: hypothetical protein HRU46_20140 [Verrucomicrobiales bacterium]|nr:hypothetical protein [Verrucomicrobiales bacterium]
MNADLMEKHFARMGARMKLVRHEPVLQPWGWNRRSFVDRFSVDIERDRRGEHFVFNVSTDVEDLLEVDLLQVQPKERHLLLMVKDPDVEGKLVKDRFLCGHDEREWFVAAVPGAVSTVASAMESLKPEVVREMQAREGLNQKQRNRRRNSAFRRQGEWFFVPVLDAFVNEDAVLQHEPIARSGGKPHFVQYLYREGGQTIYVSPQRPEGVSVVEHERLIQSRPKAKGWAWRMQRINPRVLARGEVRHPDHKTITLHGWHEVLMNRENQSRTMQRVAFID